MMQLKNWLTIFFVLHGTHSDWRIRFSGITSSGNPFGLVKISYEVHLIARQLMSFNVTTTHPVVRDLSTQNQEDYMIRKL